jgi:dual specificity phosphatase 3
MIANISQLNNRLWTGGDLSNVDRVAKDQLSDMETRGITAIIDTRLESDDGEFISEVSNIKPFWMGVDDHGGGHDETWWGAGILKARELLDNGENLLIHCHMGINRGPSLAGLVLVDYFGMNPIEAWNLIRAKRPFAWAIYMPDGVKKYLGKRVDAINLRHWIEANDDGTMEETIGKIRLLQRNNITVTPYTVMRDLYPASSSRKAQGYKENL